MAAHALSDAPEDPIALVESCYRALQWLLATRTVRGLLIPWPWIDHPYGEEAITLLEEEAQALAVASRSRWSTIGWISCIQRQDSHTLTPFISHHESGVAPIQWTGFRAPRVRVYGC